jgi:protein ERP2
VIVWSSPILFCFFLELPSSFIPSDQAVWKMVGWKLCVLTFLILSGLLIHVGETVDLSIQIPAGHEECFFELGTVNKTLSLDYTVLAASQGELDINFQLTDPYNRPLVTEFRKSDSSHNIPVTVEGLYKACFDNTFSHFSVKTVAFGIALENEDEANWREYQDIDFQPEGVYDVTIGEIQEKTDRVRIMLTKIQRLQDEFRETESRDRSTVEHNYERVNFWSLVNLAIMVCVGFIQVYMVKGLFDEQYGAKRILRMATGKN